MTSSSSSSPIVATGSLAAELDGGRAGRPVILDVRWTVGAGSDEAGFEAGHLPGAVFVDLDVELAGPAGSGGRHPLPDVAELQKTWRSKGLSDDSTVVLYDAGDGSGAVRAWWLLRWSGLSDVRVLDGGLAAWQKNGGLLESGQVVAEPGNITVRPGGMPTVDADAAEALADGDGLLLDARAAARYRGEFEPLDPVAGHIPGAVNLPYAELYVDGQLRPSAELRARLEAAGMQIGQSVAMSCGSGVTANHLILAAVAAGFANPALYPGSYSEWCALGRPVEAGRPRDTTQLA